MPRERFDLLILGGGLAGGLCALALAQRRPELTVGIVEPGERLGGNHLWSFFESDVTARDREIVEPLVVHRWPGYRVDFPEHGRRLDQAYRSIESERLDQVVKAALPPERLIRAAAVEVTSTSATLDSGEVLTARAVLDARGGKAEVLRLGWPKFLGQLLHGPQGHGLDERVVVDAAVYHADG